MKLIVSILFIVSSYNLVLACSCSNTSNISDEQARKNLEDVKAIFYGEVILIDEKSSIPNNLNEDFAGYKSVKFKVLRSWKGIENPEITIEADMESSCRVYPEVGSKMIVYAYKYKPLNSPFLMNYCSVNHFDDEKMKKILGEGKVIEQPQSSPTPIEQTESFWSNLWKKITSFFS